MMPIIQQMDFSHTISVQWMATICGCWHELTSPPRQRGVVVTNGGTTIEVQSNHKNICHYLSCDIWRNDGNFSTNNRTFLPDLDWHTWQPTTKTCHLTWIRLTFLHLLLRISCLICVYWLLYSTKPYSKLNSSHITTKWSILAHICIIHHWWIISHHRISVRYR